MSQKLINTRIGLKYDTYANWTRKGTWSEGVFTPNAEAQNTYWEGFKPLAGEVVFFSIPASTGAVSQEPAILFKVGDGTNFLKNLPWGSAIAADVYAWAKNQSLLGGNYDPNTQTWTWESGSGYDQERNEVAAFINEHGEHLQVQIIGTGNPNEFQLQTSTDGGTTWDDAGDPFAVTFTGGNGISVTGNQISIDTNSDYIGFDSNNGLDIVRTEVTYTPVSGETPASLTATGTGLVDNSAISQIKSYVDAKNGESVVNVQKQETAETGYAATYIVTQNGTQVGAKINIPKDFLVKSATLEVVDTPNVPYQGAEVGDKYIDFVINTKDSSAGTDETHIYLPVNDLVDVYTGNYDSTKGPGLTTAVTIEVGSNNQISAHTYTQTVAAATEQQDGLATALDVKTYVDNATPNIAAGDGINVTTSGTTKTVEVKLGTTPALGFDSGDGLEVVLDETTQTTGLTQSSGLQKTANGLRIDDTLTWVFQCGGALNVIE